MAVRVIGGHANPAAHGTSISRSLGHDDAPERTDVLHDAVITVPVPARVAVDAYANRPVQPRSPMLSDGIHRIRAQLRDRSPVRGDGA